VTVRRPGVLVNGPVAWNRLVALERLPDARPQMLVAQAHWDGLGGTSAGKALALASMGVDVRLRTLLGTDADAARIRRSLDHPRLTLDALVVDGPSEHHLNLMSADGARVSVYLDSPQLLAAGTEQDDAGQLLAGIEVAVLDLAPHSVPLIAEARRAGAQVWCDLHDDDGRAPFQQPFRDGADVVVVSQDRLPDPEGFLRARIDEGAHWAVCTRGGSGALALSADDGWFDVDALRVPAVLDTNGAGDSFAAGLLAAHLAGLAFEECLRWASAAGGMAVTSRDLVPAALDAARVAEGAKDVGVRRR
jgi:sugar/nucleoside kinase (ribokinase family)